MSERRGGFHPPPPRCRLTPRCDARRVALCRTLPKTKAASSELMIRLSVCGGLRLRRRGGDRSASGLRLRPRSRLRLRLRLMLHSKAHPCQSRGKAPRAGATGASTIPGTTQCRAPQTSALRAACRGRFVAHLVILGGKVSATGPQNARGARLRHFAVSSQAAWRPHESDHRGPAAVGQRGSKRGQRHGRRVPASGPVTDTPSSRCRAIQSRRAGRSGVQELGNRRLGPRAGVQGDGEAAVLRVRPGLLLALWPGGELLCCASRS